MATYFHGGTEIQADGLQTLYLMNPNYVGYSDTQQSLFSGNALNPASINHAPPSHGHHHFVGVPLPAASTAIRSSNGDDPSRQSIHFQNEISTLHGMAPRFQYNLWSAAADKYPTSTVEPISPAADVVSQLGFHRPVQKSLSLSLSAQHPVYRPPVHGEDRMTVETPATVMSSDEGRGLRASPSSASAVSNGMAGVQSVLLGSKYLKAAQELLDEVVNVGKSMKIDAADELGKEKVMMMKMGRESTAGEVQGGGGGESSGKRGVEIITTAQRHELQMKKAKLINMLDEVEQRYRQYHQQMQIVANSFEQVAGPGSAKSYTALALQTISKQFRCLKDAISAQIKVTAKSLGEEDCSILSSGGGGSRLKLVDHQLRQQRALQQLGMIQHTAWRPQRGLPERAVSVLRAWLFEHFLHPYPKDSDKHMLARQTGLSRSQVSNWFINARVRLWKPMVEEMYMEEIKDQQQQNNPQPNNNIKDEMGSKSTAQQEISNTIHDQLDQITTLEKSSTSPNEISNSTASTSPQLGAGSMQAQMEWLVQRSPKKPRGGSGSGSDMHTSITEMLSMNMEKQNRDGDQYIPSPGNGFGAYPIGELGRYDDDDQVGARYSGNNGVSLTLGLPHNCENLSLSGTQHSYMPNSQNIHQVLEMGNVDHSGVGFENLNIQSRKRFAAQLLRDFVA